MYDDLMKQIYSSILRSHISKKVYVQEEYIIHKHNVCFIISHGIINMFIKTTGVIKIHPFLAMFVTLMQYQLTQKR